MSVRPALATLAVLAVLTACTPSSPGNGPTPSGSQPTATVPAEPPVTVQQPPPPTGSAPDAPRHSPGVPDPTAAGPLNQSVLPNPVLGFAATVGEAQEGEYNPNGTWVHAVDPVAQSREAIPACATTRNTPPAAAYALAATYADPQGRPGNGLALEFASPADAAAWWQAYTDQLRACSQPGAPIAVTELDASADRFVARRAFPTGETWSETGRLTGARVVLVLIAGAEHSLPALRATLG